MNFFYKIFSQASLIIFTKGADIFGHDCNYRHTAGWTDGRTDGQIDRSILYCLRCTPYIPSPSLTCSLCLLFSEVYWLFRSKAKMRRFRQQPQKQPAIRGIFISIHGVSVSACLREREKGVSTLCSHSPVQQQGYRTLFWGHGRTVLMWWCMCVWGV